MLIGWHVRFVTYIQHLREEDKKDKKKKRKVVRLPVPHRTPQRRTAKTPSDIAVGKQTQ